MNRIFRIACWLLLICTASSLAETLYTVNDRPITDMRIEELYILEDAVRSAINEVFASTSQLSESGEIIGTYAINTKTNKFHYPYCYSALQIGSNLQFEYCTASQLVDRGYSPCGQCNPYVDKPGE